MEAKNTEKRTITITLDEKYMRMIDEIHTSTLNHPMHGALTNILLNFAESSEDEDFKQMVRESVAKVREEVDYERHVKAMIDTLHNLYKEKEQEEKHGRVFPFPMSPGPQFEH